MRSNTYLKRLKFLLTSFHSQAPTSSRSFFYIVPCLIFFSACSNYFKNDYRDNSPTSGKLKVYYDEGIHLHVKNQALTFESQYADAEIELFSSSQEVAIQALYNDSCEAIVISRLLNQKEKKIFESKNFFPKYSAVAKSGVALITNAETSIKTLTIEDIKELLNGKEYFTDTVNSAIKLKVLLDRNNSAVVHYLMDSILNGQKLSEKCNVLGSSIESINYVAQHKNCVAFLDFAWLSDMDDSITIANRNKIKFMGIKNTVSNTIEYPSPSSFKLQTYPLTTTIYVLRKTGDFTLAKGFESFVAGPKGQLIFLKQGLLPTRQSERAVEVKMEPMNIK